MNTFFTFPSEHIATEPNPHTAFEAPVVKIDVRKKYSYTCPECGNNEEGDYAELLKVNKWLISEGSIPSEKYTRCEYCDALIAMDIVDGDNQ